jgi:hypothetical protein
MDQELRFRWSVVSASAWRLVAELVRRHDAQHDLRVAHLHPGMSSWGLLRLQEGWGWDTERSALSIHLGGGGNATLEVNRPWGTPNLDRRVNAVRGKMRTAPPGAAKVWVCAYCRSI